MPKQDIQVTTEGKTLKVKITEKKAGFRIDSTYISVLVFGFAIYEKTTGNMTGLYSFANVYAWAIFAIVMLGQFAGFYGLNRMEKFRRQDASFKYEVMMPIGSIIRMVVPQAMMFLAGFEIRALILGAIMALYQVLRFNLAARTR